MHKDTTPLTIRIPSDVRIWLDYQKSAERKPHNTTIVSALRVAMAEDPLEIFIHECAAPDGTFFTVSIGKHGDDFYEGPSREDAFTAARNKVKELGLSRDAIRFETENFNA